ncbi:nuclear RNA export factor 3-like [Echinops telfairi]|uniref:Nuclear RNA export factor 3-like n=1 Tax=Echinops telfairi TaxID=9371 RepID=A0AC55D496_ECHTE|nr:nuclear RNA export factor 3-like [Echinops telfairi]
MQRRHGDNRIVLPRSARSRCIPRSRVPIYSEQAIPSINQLPRQEQGDHMARRHAWIRSGVRYTPYHIPSYKQRDTYHKGHQTHGSMERERKDPEAGMAGNRQDGSTGSFSKITVTKMKGDEVCQEAHDLLRLHSDPGLMHRATETGLNVRKDMACSLQIHEENMPEAEEEMDTGKGLEPEEICVGRKPLCTISPDKPSNMSDILQLFPKLLSLDRQGLPSPVFSDIVDDKKLPVCKGNVFGIQTLKNLVWKFLKQYYRIYDGGDRQGLLSAYHDNACFSLTTLFNPERPSLISLAKYSNDSESMKQFKDIGPYVQLVKHTKSEIVDFLSVLPKTQHDLSSFMVDVGAQTKKMLCFSVRGQFKDENMCEAHVCAFERTFLLTTGCDSSIYIFNDQLTVTEMNPNEIPSAFFTPEPTPSCSFVPSTSQEQQEVQQALCTSSDSD